MLLEALDGEEQLSIELVWEAIESKVSREELRAAIAYLAELAPPPDAEPGGEWRATLVDRYALVRSFLPALATSIQFGATTDAAPVLAAMRDLPGLLDLRATNKVPAGYLDERRIAVDVVNVPRHTVATAARELEELFPITIDDLPRDHARRRTHRARGRRFRYRGVNRRRSLPVGGFERRPGYGRARRISTPI